MKITCIEFEDQGQDFLYWYVNESGAVVDAQPFQGNVWVGMKVSNLPKLKRGGHVLCRVTRGEPLSVKYPVTQVYEVAPVEVSVQYQGGAYVTNTQRGKRSSSTCSERGAVEAQAKKLFPDLICTVEELSHVVGKSHWKITPERHECWVA